MLVALSLELARYTTDVLSKNNDFSHSGYLWILSQVTPPCAQGAWRALQANDVRLTSTKWSDLKKIISAESVM